MEQTLLTFKDFKGVTQECVLEDNFPLTFELKPGEIGIFKGGIKASSLARMAALRGIITQGSITILGTSINAGDDPAEYLSHDFTKRFKTSIGFCHRAGGLLSNMTCLDNVMLPAHYHSSTPDTEPSYELAKVKLREIEVPEEYWEVRPSEAPLEIKKRVLLARSIINDPKILILEEPTMHFQWVQAGEVIDWIFKQKEQGRGLLIATSNEPFAWLVADWLIDFNTQGALVDKLSMGLFTDDIVIKSSNLLREQLVSWRADA